MEFKKENIIKCANKIKKNTMEIINNKDYLIVVIIAIVLFFVIGFIAGKSYGYSSCEKDIQNSFKEAFGIK